jgi:uncharacterized RDD family membrane protein YckC
VKSFELETPEAVVVRFPIADLAARVIAFVMDLGIIALAAAILLIGAGLATGVTGLMEPVAVALVGLFFVRHFYFVFFEVRWHGQTPGKRMMGIRVIAREGSGLGVDAIVARNLVRDVELFVPIVLLAAPEQFFGAVAWWTWIPAVLWLVVVALLPLLTRDRLRAGDLVGGTIVVRLPAARLMADEAARTSHAPARPEDTIELTPAQLAIYGERELEALADLIRKIDDDKATIEDQRHIALTIAKKIAYVGREPAHEPTRFLRTFYKRQRAVLEKQLLFGKRKASKDA